ncbi:MAG: hypothetical protein ACE5HJ_08745 [Thermoplasmata archaeon]
MDPECAHKDVEFIGEDRGRNRYFRCKACSSVLVTDGTKTWSIPSSTANGQ